MANKSNPLLYLITMGNELEVTIIFRKKTLIISDILSIDPCPSYNSSMVVRRASLISVGLFNPYFVMSQDKELYLRIVDHFGIQYVNKPLIIWKMHDKIYLDLYV